MPTFQRTDIGIPQRHKISQKLPISAILGLEAHISKVTMVKFGSRVRVWESLPQLKFYFFKSLKGVYPFGQIYTKTKNTFGDLGSVSLHFKSDNG